MKAVIFAIMGCSCSGKSTFIEEVKNVINSSSPAFKMGTVEVGKMLRAKYPPSHFQGQAAPAHTQEEAWALCLESIKELLEKNVKVIFVDGQPRSIDQIFRMAKLPEQLDVCVRYVSLYTDPLTRMQRGIYRDSLNRHAMYLTMQRFHNDPPAQYEIIMNLLAAGTVVRVVDTTFQPAHQTLEILLAEAQQYFAH